MSDQSDEMNEFQIEEQQRIQKLLNDLPENTKNINLCSDEINFMLDFSRFKDLEDLEALYLCFYNASYIPDLSSLINLKVLFIDFVDVNEFVNIDGFEYRICNIEQNFIPNNLVYYYVNGIRYKKTEYGEYTYCTNEQRWTSVLAMLQDTTITFQVNEFEQSKELQKLKEENAALKEKAEGLMDVKRDAENLMDVNEILECKLEHQQDLLFELQDKIEKRFKVKVNIDLDTYNTSIEDLN